jgi:hypothetical protein
LQTIPPIQLFAIPLFLKEKEKRIHGFDVFRVVGEDLGRGLFEIRLVAIQSAALLTVNCCPLSGQHIAATGERRSREKKIFFCSLFFKKKTRIFGRLVFMLLELTARAIA